MNQLELMPVERTEMLQIQEDRLPLLTEHVEAFRTAFFNGKNNRDRKTWLAEFTSNFYNICIDDNERGYINSLFFKEG